MIKEEKDHHEASLLEGRPVGRRCTVRSSWRKLEKETREVGTFCLTLPTSSMRQLGSMGIKSGEPLIRGKGAHSQEP